MEGMAEHAHRLLVAHEIQPHEPGTRRQRIMGLTSALYIEMRLIDDCINQQATAGPIFQAALGTAFCMR